MLGRRSGAPAAPEERAVLGQGWEAPAVGHLFVARVAFDVGAKPCRRDRAGLPCGRTAGLPSLLSAGSGAVPVRPPSRAPFPGACGQTRRGPFGRRRGPILQRPLAAAPRAGPCSRRSGRRRGLRARGPAAHLPCCPLPCCSPPSAAFGFVVAGAYLSSWLYVFVLNSFPKAKHFTKLYASFRNSFEKNRSANSVMSTFVLR